MQASRARAVTLLGVVGGLVLLAHAAGGFLPPLALRHWVVAHTLLEAVAVIVAALIFAVGTSYEGRSASAPVAWLGFAFLAVALFDGVHLLTYPGMPPLIDDGGYQTHLICWLAARLTTAAAMLAVAAKRSWSPWNERERLLASAAVLGFVAVVLWFALAAPHSFPLLRGPQGSTPAKQAVEWLVTALNLAALALLARRRGQPGFLEHDGLLLSVGLMALSEASVIRFSLPGDLDNVLGHVCKTLAFAALYRAVFVAAVRQPYRALQASQRDLLEAQAAIRRSENALRQTQKFDALGRLAGTIAHDFNNLLAAVLPASTQLAEELPAGSHSQQAAADIEQAARRGIALTRQLLTFGREQAWTPEPADLGALVRDFSGLVRRLAGSSLRLEFSTGPDALPISADRAQLEQVVLNLVVNARDAVQPGGQVSVRTTRCCLTSPEAGVATTVAPGEWALLEVRDTGPGIPPEVLPHIFEPFFTTKPAGKGTGLGLATVFGIVRRHGGHVMVESGPGAGTLFRVLLPLTPPPSPPAPPSPDLPA